MEYSSNITMLCEKCSALVFVELVRQPLETQDDAMDFEHDLTDFHCDRYENQRSLEITKDQCYLCYKIWHMLLDWDEREHKPISNAFPIQLCLHNIRRVDLDNGRIQSGYLSVYGKGDEVPRTDVRDNLSFILRPYSSDQYSTITRVDTSPLTPLQHRELDDNIMSYTAIHQARKWLQKCIEKHEKCAGDLTQGMLPRRVLDISDTFSVRLISGIGVYASYATLSYKWGSGERYLLTSVNLHGLEQGISTQPFPRTFRDAVEVAHSLGIRYLWIDAFCILQDLPEELSEQISLMGDIYSRSSLTIFAVHGDSAHQGLRARRDAAYVQPIPINVTIQSMVNEGQFSLLIVQPSSGQGRCHTRNVESPLLQRGWVLQEQVLSRRCLLFTEQEVQWQCLSEKLCEHLPSSKELDDYVYERIRDPIGDARELVIQADVLSSTPTWKIGHEFNNDWIARQWYSLMTLYMERELSHVSDTLPAISGIAALFSQLMPGTRYLAGIWEQGLGIGLTWVVNKYSGRGVDDRSKPAVPSWSWTSQFGTGHHVVFKDPFHMDENWGPQMVNSSIKLLNSQNTLDPASDTSGIISRLMLTVQGYTKRFELYHDDSGSYQEWKLMDIITGLLVDFEPDISEICLGPSSSAAIKCLLCTCHHSESKSKYLRWAAIVLSPIAERVRLYKRIGLASSWSQCPFGRITSRYLEKANDVELETLDLI